MAIIIPLTEKESKLIYDEIPKNLKKPLEQLNYLQNCNNKKVKQLLKEKEAAVMLQLISNGAYIQTALPLTDDYHIISETLLTPGYDLAQSTYIQNSKTDQVFDLTLVDLYQDYEDDCDNDSDIKYISSYLYANPQSEDYQEKRIVQIKDMDEIIKEELEWEKN
ncbi:MAG: hypothetical protein D8H99_34240 [Streptococcus sp.]|nr:MAG: hypothetical protein D8H99_34240 [Streptococcus sp.]